MNTKTNYEEKYRKYKEKYNALRRNMKGGQNNLSRYQTPDFMYQRGGADLKLKIDELYFWGTQVLEHFEVYTLGTVSDPNLNPKDLDDRIKDMAPIIAMSKDVATELKLKADELFEKWKVYMKSVFEDKGVKLRKISLENMDYDKLGEIPADKLNEAKQLVAESIIYKKKYEEVQNNGAWVGWLFPDFSKHVREEAEFLNKKLNDVPENPLEEIEFYNKNAEDAGLSAHLINPSQVKDMMQAHNLFMKYFDLKLTDKNSAISASLQYQKQLEQFYMESMAKMKTKALKSVIPAKVAAHNLREVLRAQMKLVQLQKQ